MPLKLSWVFIAIVAAAGCVGAIEDSADGTTDDTTDGDDNTVPSDKEGPGLYKRTVHPIMAKCQGGGCHNIDATSGALSKFYAPDADTTYAQVALETSLVGTFTAAAPIIAYMAKTPPHFVTYVGTEVATIQTWLAAETADRAGEPPVEPVDLLSPLRAWSGCMTLADFTASEMAPAWGSMAGTSPNKSCKGCHDSGLGNFVTTLDATRFFNLISRNGDLLRRYFAVDGTGQVVVNIGAITTASNGTIQGHPQYDPLNNPGTLALQEYYLVVKAKQTAATCGPSTLIDP